ncbi:paralemmin-3 isoform X1 [Arapaima gigas]
MRGKWTKCSRSTEANSSFLSPLKPHREICLSGVSSEGGSERRGGRLRKICPRTWVSRERAREGRKTAGSDTVHLGTIFFTVCKAEFSGTRHIRKTRSGMDEAEKYQQRLQVIAEKRRLQEEQDRARREMEDEKLRLQQLKRKSLRDQWLMEGPTIIPDSSAPRSPLWGSQAQEIEACIDKLQVESQRLAEEKAKLEKLEEEGRALNDTGRESGSEVSIPLCYPPAPGSAQVSPKFSSFPTGFLKWHLTVMQSFIPTVLGVVQVQVEKDLKTGATIIKSVAPLAPGTADCSGEVLFDDGSKSVRAAGGADPSPEELGQVLSAVAGVGTLVEAQVMVNGRKAETEEAHVAPVGENGFGEEEEEDKVKCNASSPPQPEEISCENNPPGDTELGMNDGAVEGTTDGAVEGTITMTFLGFATAEPGQGLNGEDVGEIIRAERVIITDDGEDHPVMNEVPASEGKEEPSEPSEPPSAEKPHLDVRKENVEAEACSNGQINTDTEAEPRGAEADTEGEAEAKLDAGEGEKADEGDVPEATSTGDTIEAPQVTVDSRPAPDTVGAAAGDEEEKPVAAVVLTEQFQDVPLDSEPKHGTSATEPELQPLVGTAEANNVTAEQEPLVSASQAPPDTKGAAPSRADGGTAPKQKSCQCCSVM